MIFAWWHVLVALLPMIPTFWSLLHIWYHDFNGDFQKKSLWLVLTVFLPCLGGLIYIFCGIKYSGKKIPRRPVQASRKDDK